MLGSIPLNLARLNKCRKVKPNTDKPHRCPECHSISDEARKDGRALIGKKYVCVKCNVWWIYTQAMQNKNNKRLKKIKAKSISFGDGTGYDKDGKYYSYTKNKDGSISPSWANTGWGNF